MDKLPSASKKSRFVNIVQQAPVGITIFRGKDMVVEMANQTYLQIVDRKEAEFIGRSLYDSLPEVRAFVEPLLDNVYQTGIPYHGFEFPVILNRYGNKELTYFNFVYQALKEEDGTVTGIIVVANEITHLVKTKQDIAESERQFRNLVRQSPIAMVIFRGPDYIIESPNTTLMETIWFKKEEEVVGKRLLDIFPELEAQKYPELLKKVRDTGIIHSESEALAIVGEQAFYLDFEYAPLRDTEGHITGIMCTVYDVTEKVVSRQKVEEANERLHLAVEATGLANWDLDLGNDSIIHSPRLAEILGYPADKILTHPEMRSRVLPEDLYGVVSNAFEEALETGVYQYEARIRQSDGKVGWIKTQGKMIFNEDKKPVKIIGTLKDITEEKTFAQELERQVRERTKELAEKNEALEKMNAELKSFAYVSSHDLQEPLRKIRVFSERILDLEKDNFSAKGRDYFGRIEKAATTMQTLIKDLLIYSKASNPERNTEVLSADEALKEVLELFKEEIEEKHAKIIASNLGTLHAIPFQFKQLLTNLISNSLKFAMEGRAPQIEVAANVVDAEHMPIPGVQSHVLYYHLSVKDNGIGFESTFNERIFEIFQRLNHRDEFKGTGIGLAIVKKIVDNHQGFITARGTFGEGAMFDIYFPILP